MSSLPNEIFRDVTNFLPNDDITDLMLLSKTFNALLTPRLKKIDQEMTTMNQSIKTFLPSPAPAPTDNEWISQLNLKRFEPIGSLAKKRMKRVFENEEESIVDNTTLTVVENRIVVDCMTCDIHHLHMLKTFDILKEGMSLERFDDMTFLRILGALVAMPEFRQEYNISSKLTRHFIVHVTIFELLNGPGLTDDVLRIWEHVLRTEKKQSF